MNILEDKLISLKTDVNSIKASQYLGGSNYRVYYQQTHIDTSLNGNYAWWVFFRANSNFPLVNFGFEVYENNERKVSPRNYWVNTGGTSIASYSFSTSFGSLMHGWSLPSFSVDAANIYVGLLEMSGSSSGSGKIVLKAKTSCEGVLGFEAAGRPW